jgi:hypothetical protein
MYRNITIGDTVYRAELQALTDHRITIKDGEVSVSADLDGRTSGAEFEAAFTGRGDTRVLVAPEKYTINDAIMEPGDDLKMAKAPKLAAVVAELDALDRKSIRTTAAIVAATAAGNSLPVVDVAKIDDLEQRKVELRAAMTQISVATTVEEVEAVSWGPV